MKEQEFQSLKNNQAFSKVNSKLIYIVHLYDLIGRFCVKNCISGRRFAYKFFFPGALHFIVTVSIAQSSHLDDEALLRRLENYTKTKSSSTLFLHTDKTLYTNGETLWFGAYLIEKDSVLTTQHNVLSLALIREGDAHIGLQKKFVMEKGLSSGSVFLPDSLYPGAYQLVAYSNLLDSGDYPVALFKQALTIKNTMRPSFTATLSLLDTTPKDGTIKAQVHFAADPSEAAGKDKPALYYTIGKDFKQAATLKDSRYLISIPDETLLVPYPVLHAKVTYGQQVQHLSLLLPSRLSEVTTVDFYPEGGSLIDGIATTVAWEVKTSNTKSSRAVLFCDNRAIDTVTTNSNGIGSFKLTPNANCMYSMKLLQNGPIDTAPSFTLPKVNLDGVVLHIASAVVKDTVAITLFSKTPQNVRVLVHNYQEEISLFAMKAKPSGSRALVALPPEFKGLATVTVLDEQGKRLAERILFAGYGNKITATIETSKATYGKKDSVHLKMKLKNSEGHAVDGIISIAVVQEVRLEKSKACDIESYTYLEKELGKKSLLPGRVLDDRTSLEALLRVQSWKQHRWEEVLAHTGQKQERSLSAALLIGTVKRDNKKLNKPVILTVIQGNQIELISTSDKGAFYLENRSITTTDGGKIFLGINGKSEGYAVELNDPYVRINKTLATGIQKQFYVNSINLQQNTETDFEELSKPKLLQEVVVKAQNKGIYNGWAVGANACGDYVCIVGILNCPTHVNHPKNTKPVNGEHYMYIWVGEDGREYYDPRRRKAYQGCSREATLGLKPLEGIYKSRRFYGVDTSAGNLTTPQYLSTLFWQSEVIVQKDRAFEFSFFTSDITGRFRIIVQGISNNGVIYGETYFDVE